MEKIKGGRMSATPSFRFSFDGYTVRSITEADRVGIDFCIEQDEYHQGKMDADFFLRIQPGEEAWALENDKGAIVFYFKTSIAVRMDIQFTPVTSITNVRQNQNALMKGFQWIEGLFRAKHFNELIFEPQGPELYVFAKKRLGFVDASIVSRRLSGLHKVTEIQPKAVGTVPTDGLEVGETR